MVKHSSVYSPLYLESNVCFRYVLDLEKKFLFCARLLEHYNSHLLLMRKKWPVWFIEQLH